MNKKFLNLYTRFLRKFFKIKKPLKAVFDCSNGTAGLILKNFLKPKTQNLKPIFINQTPDGNFPAHGPNPLGPGALKQLRAAVKKQRADLGVIFDVDGDRIFIIDDQSRFVNPDIVAWLLIWHLEPKKVIIDARFGWLVKKFQVSSSKFQVFESKVGHYFIEKLIREKKADFGAEQSGHYYFKKFFNADSGILAAIEIINAVSRLPYKLSELIEFLPAYYRSGELNFPVKQIKQKERLMNRLKKEYQHKAVKISELDGLKMEFNPPAGKWWFNIRPSNTEPLIRLNIEAVSKKILDQKIKEFRSFIASCGRY